MTDHFVDHDGIRFRCRLDGRGRRDARHDERLADHIPNARFVEIAHAVHIPGIERAPAVNAMLASFLDGQA